MNSFALPNCSRFLCKGSKRRSVAASAAKWGGAWLVSFMHHDLGYIDLKQKTLQPIVQPFGTRLLPVPWEQGATFVSVSEKAELAERVGFEPTVRLHVHTLSKRAP